MRIAIGQLVHETNTFSNVKTTIDLFKLWEWDHGDVILQKHCGVKNYLGGMIDRGNELGIKIIPTFSAWANPSGIITKETYRTAKQELISAIEGSGDLDAICIFLHGAGVAEGVDDLEGDLLTALRMRVGYKMPIVTVLDLHGNITEAMIKESNAIFGNVEYPHTDSYERGIEAIDLTVGILIGKVKPEMGFTKLPLLIPTTTSYNSPVKEINEWCLEWEKHPEVIDCTFYHGFPYSDIPYAGASIITTTNNNPHLAQRVSNDIASRIWEIKDKFFPTLPSPEEAITYASSRVDFPIVINEASDNPGAGTPGDGTYLLKEMIKADIPNTCFGFIYDPEVADIAHKTGVGSLIQVELGGKTDTLHGKSLKISAYVKCLTDGEFIQSSPMWRGSKVNLGKSARLKVGNVDVIVCSVRSQTFDEQIFLLHGIDVLKSKIIGLKSSHHFRASYVSIAKEIITVDSPGLSTGDLLSFNHKKINKPIYPFDTVFSELFSLTK
ncbi:M81 family metallopeptidase [Peribacillus frigoritolerans]|uniref:M81 family metallopeptidase n=1 Tax=Peribacillus frigoritolerans TaxID=450367 RepID=UPI0039A132DE